MPLSFFAFGGKEVERVDGRGEIEVYGELDKENKNCGNCEKGLADRSQLNHLTISPSSSSLKNYSLSPPLLISQRY